MNKMFLNTQELQELTNRVQHQAQAKMLRSLAITFKTRSDGSLLVLRTHIEKELGGVPDAIHKKAGFQPNWDAANA